jgi:hypothetical protein
MTFDSVYEKNTVHNSKMSFQTIHFFAQASGFNFKNSPACRTKKFTVFKISL